MRSAKYTAKPENIRRTSGFNGASASKTNACGGFCFGVERDMTIQHRR